MVIQNGKMEGPARDLAETFLEIAGTQQGVAEILGVTQQTVSRWVNDPAAEVGLAVRVTAARAWTEYAVRLRWLEAFLADRLKDWNTLVQWTWRVGTEGRRLLDRKIVDADNLGDIVVGSLGMGWAASGDYFGFYRREGADTIVVSYHVNTDRKPRAALAGDPIFGG